MNIISQDFQYFKSINHIHFVGIGGVSMSALAMVLKKQGKFITGSDRQSSPVVQKLINNGIKVYIGHAQQNAVGADLIVYTAAINDKNPELVYGKENSIPLIERSTLLGMVSKDFEKSIAVSGTHGKSTTTSMISSVLLSANADPTILVGANFPMIGGNYKIGHTEYIVYEACEYVNSFLNFYPHCAVILNIDADHLDFFKDLDHIKESFLNFTENVFDDGIVIINGDDKNCKYIIDNCHTKVLTFGLSSDNDIYATDIEIKNGIAKYKLHYKNEYIGDISLGVVGDHNIYNSLACAATAIYYGIDIKFIQKGISSFKGTGRRFEIKGSYNSINIIDDYAHHPNEIKATIKTAKSMNYNKVFVAFQPHTYTRTYQLFDDFAEALSLADQVVLTDIYSAREINTVGVNVIDLKNKIKNCVYISSFEDIASYFKENAKPGDVIIYMGAGNINDGIKYLI